MSTTTPIPADILARVGRVIEIADTLYIEADGDGIAAHEAAREDATGERLNVVALECLKSAHGNLGLLGNRTQGDATALTRLAMTTG